jgi:magnesium-transporting ATPase (P-type)
VTKLASWAIIVSSGLASAVIIFVIDRIGAYFGSPSGSWLQLLSEWTVFFVTAAVLGRWGSPFSVGQVIVMALLVVIGIAIGVERSAMYALKHEHFDRNLWPFEIVGLWIVLIPLTVAGFSFGRWIRTLNGR